MNEKELQEIKRRYRIIGNAPKLNRALDIALQVAPTDLSVLIEGENGVGKEIIPRIIHDYSRRNTKNNRNRYFAINCGSIPEGTIDSELFGHEKGSFTGALNEHKGYFEAADGGTLFLDEVGELPLSTQVRLLRVLETGEFLRVGSNEVRQTDVRIVAATNVKMKRAISEGRFREDLYYRLATIPIAMPPLRDRGEDIPLLFRYFASQMAEKYHLDPVELTDDGRSLLMSYKWPGNIRQLKNITEQLSIISPERKISAERLQEFGVTDDNASEGGLVLSRDNANSTSHSYEKEREMLLQQIFTLGTEVKELRKRLDEMSPNVQGGALSVSNYPVAASLHAATHDMPYNESPAHAILSPAYPTHISPRPDKEERLSGMDNDIIEAEPYEEPKPQSIRELTKNSIIEALKRNENNRKRAAEELGISERTIYRKIHQLGIDD